MVAAAVSPDVDVSVSPGPGRVTPTRRAVQLVSIEPACAAGTQRRGSTSAPTTARTATTPRRVTNPYGRSPIVIPNPSPRSTRLASPRDGADLRHATHLRSPGRMTFGHGCRAERHESPGAGDPQHLIR